MKPSQTTSDLVNFIKVLKRILETFRSEEKLSDFERGQLDGLRWALQVAQEVE